MFVIMLECREAKRQAQKSLSKERDFLSSAGKMDPGKDASSPHCCLCGLKGSTYCAACCQDGAGQAGERGRWDSPEGVVESSPYSSQYGQNV